MQSASRLSERLGNSVFFKREDLQPGYSFKASQRRRRAGRAGRRAERRAGRGGSRAQHTSLRRLPPSAPPPYGQVRGAYNKMAAMRPEDLKGGVLAYAVGGHAEGVAIAAHKLGVKVRSRAARPAAPAPRAPPSKRAEPRTPPTLLAPPPPPPPPRLRHRRRSCCPRTRARGSSARSSGWARLCCCTAAATRLRWRIAWRSQSRAAARSSPHSTTRECWAAQGRAGPRIPFRRPVRPPRQRRRGGAAPLRPLSLPAPPPLRLVLPTLFSYVIAGQGTVGLEALRQLSERPPHAIFVCVGGGGLLAGVAACVKAINPNVKVRPSAGRPHRHTPCPRPLTAAGPARCAVRR